MAIDLMPFLCIVWCYIGCKVVYYYYYYTYFASCTGSILIVSSKASKYWSIYWEF